MDARQAELDSSELLLRKLRSIAELGAEEEDAIARIPLRIATYPAHSDIIREGDRPSECCLVLDGFACRYKIVVEGKRQILSFHPPGDIPDLQSLYLRVMDHSLATLTPTRVGFIAHQHLMEMTRTRPMVAAAFWRDSLIDASIFREWMVGLGRRTALQRVAHLLCEMAMRLSVVTIADDAAYDLPVTQTDLADATGLSNVHVNRTLTELREKQLILVRRTRVRILDWDGLRRTADFDPTYLHQRPIDLRQPSGTQGFADLGKLS